MKKIVVLLFALILLAGCTSTNNTITYECISKQNNPRFNIRLESDEDGLITKILQSSEEVANNKEALIEKYEAYKKEREAVGIEYSYEFNENDMVLTTMETIDVDKLDKDYLANDSLFAFYETRSIEEFVEAYESDGYYICEIK